MPLLHEFKREEKLPSYFVNRLQDFLSAAHTDLRLKRKSATEVEVAPAEPYALAAIDLQGLWRFRTSAVSRAHPGGGAGTYAVWAVATKQKVVEAPKPFTDETDYSFDLRITDGKDPEGAGVEVFEKIGEVDWDGAKITALRQTCNAVTGPMIQDGALSDSGDLSWARDASGALVPQIAEGAVTPAKIATWEAMNVNSKKLAAPQSLLVRLDKGTSVEINNIESPGVSGQIVIFRISNVGAITFDDAAVESNLHLAGKVTLDSQDTITLIYDPNLSGWVEISRSTN